MKSMTFQDRSSKEYEIVCYHCSSIQKYTLKDINNFPIRPKKNCSKCKKTIYLTIGIEGNKIVVKPIKDPIIEKLTEQLNNLKKDKVYTKTPLKESFHDSNIDNGLKDTYKHFLTLFNSFPNIPLFLYSEVYNRFIARCGDYDDNNKNWSLLSFYDVYMSVINDVCNKKLDNRIMEYEGNTLQLYGNIVCQYRYGVAFEREILEKVSYWTEEYAQEWLEKQLTENPEHCIKYNLDLEKINNHDKKHAKDMIEEGIYIEDYSEALEMVEEFIAKSLEFVSELQHSSNGQTLKSFKAITSKILLFIFFELDFYHSFLFRDCIISKEDIKKIVLEHNLYNSKKESFVERVREHNVIFISYVSSSMTVDIEKDYYIDLGTHGNECLGINEAYYKEDGEWILKETYFDTIKWV